MVRNVQLCECVHVEASLRHVLHLQTLISFHIGTVRWLGARVGWTLGKVVGIGDLIGCVTGRGLRGGRCG